MVCAEMLGNLLGVVQLCVSGSVSVVVVPVSVVLCL